VDIWPGQPNPLGASYDGSGTNFAVFSELADAVELCLFDGRGHEERVELADRSGAVWHGYLPSVGHGQRYGYRVHGPYEPGRGLRCNPAKLLADPYARAMDGTFDGDESTFGHRFADPDGPANTDDSAAHVARSVVVSPFFDWADDRPPRVPLADTIIYEAHVKGFTMRHPGVPEALRGTYAGLAHPAALDHLVELGVTAVELMPVHQFVHDPHLIARGLRNYWGYNTIGYFAPHGGYAAGGSHGEQVAEFKSLVKALHVAGLEVILDVVYNHTAEGNHLGPTLSLKGFDNPAYYRLVGDDPRYYMDYTGTGNSLNARHPQVLQLIMDSLRYWVTEMHVDGFRFDLASTLARGLHEVDRLSAFFDLIQQDPVVNRVKLIAEPWDVGEGGYQVGNFPWLWSEWNGRYRDCVRDYWRGEPATLPELANRLTGSSDLYQGDRRRPAASVNFVTAHDGFTLRDLVSYDEKHNEANGEDNRDGESHNRSWNCGVEGPTDDPGIRDLRRRQQRNLLATLLLAQGVPMICGGDELDRTQLGNNNAYCQDNEVSWLDWSHLETAERNAEDLVDFTRRLVRLRLDNPVFRHQRWFAGRPIGHHGDGETLADIAWFAPSGAEMEDENWGDGWALCLAVFVNGQALQSRDARGQHITGDSFLLLLNASAEAVPFTVPGSGWAPYWTVEIDTTDPHRGRDRRAHERTNSGAGMDLDADVKGGDTVAVGGRSLQVLRARESLA
jgi:isoamylase